MFLNSDAADYINEYYTEAGKNLSKENTMVWEKTDSLKGAGSAFKFDFI